VSRSSRPLFNRSRGPRGVTWYVRSPRLGERCRYLTQAMRTFDDACFGLVQYGSDWVPSLIFTRDRDRALFLEIADWLTSQFDLHLVEEYGHPSEDGKEYWTYHTSNSKWMLMRCYYPCGISLDSDSSKDFATFEMIATTINAKSVGWRYRWARLQRRFMPSRFARNFGSNRLAGNHVE
jgi:hypothetical protein